MSTRTYPMSVTFHDVAACFSAEEWVGLEDWQKDLYKKVMLEIHSALEAMGFEILNRDVLFCIKKVKDLYMDVCEKDRANSGAASSPRDPSRIMGLKQERGAHLVSCQKKGAKSTSHPACGPDLLLRIQQDDQTQQSPAHISAEPILTSVFSLQNDEEELHPADAAESRPIPAHRRLSSQAIKQEKVDYVKVSVGGHGSNGTTATPTGRPSSQLMKYEDLDYMKVPVGGPGSDGAGATSRGQVTTKPIKQEEPEYIKVSVGAQGLVNTTVSSREPVECVHPEAARSFSPQCQDAAEDSSKDSSEEPSIISPECRPHPSDVMEETAPESEPDPHDHHQFPTISSTLHNLTSHQRQSNLLMQEQNAILSQIAYSLNLLQIQQTDGLAALGNIIQRGIEVIRPASSMSPNDRTTEHSSVHTGLRRQVMNISHGDQPVPQKRKIT
ncbi:uncharacterized protein LOC122933831 isoform X3 [Bufo gargarizans]|uniref:uncharacterized protein LOC122933831 isoform X3 n=1 Tax=Bufo gargarizans TaxID=30331 RepID=UPI001CF55737|nr:uncharacterized protein LOC122933831 isoform X3 [Bufo gargarizans]